MLSSQHACRQHGNLWGPAFVGLSGILPAQSDLSPSYFHCYSEVIFRGELILSFPFPFSFLRMLIC